MLQRLVIQNYKVFEQFDLEFNETLNIIVGNNDTGKSTVLEAINLALTRRLNGRFLEQELTPHLFHQKVAREYVASLSSAPHLEPPRILLELYLKDLPELADLRGTNNSRHEDAIGVKVEVGFDDAYAEEYENLVVSRPTDVRAVPVEYYRVHWRSFANNDIAHSRALPVRPTYIDATTIRLQSGADYYLQDILRTTLEPKERVGLNLAYRELKELFSEQQAIKEINKKLATSKGVVTDKELAIAIDVSQRAGWDASLVPHLDELPFQFIGKGEQNTLKIMLALERKAESSDVLLIEEPENHLSFTTLNVLLVRMRARCHGKQMVVTTHSAYVLNKLGLKSLVLLGHEATLRLTELSEDTQEYFEKLSGYDTLRLVLARRAILVEGPSDELIVQKAYHDRHGSLPIEKGVDVISVGTSFLRFLQIAASLQIPVCVVTDNDGDCKRLDAKYAAYSENPMVRLCWSKDETLRTLEPQMIAVNGRAMLNEILGSGYGTDPELEKYMTDNKTDVALRIFRAKAVKYPEYIERAVQQE